MSDARVLVKRLFDFLEAFNQKRNPVVRDVSNHAKSWWWSDIPESPYVRRAPFEDPLAEDDTTSFTDEFVLQVARATVRSAPKPPAGVDLWLDDGWDDPSGDASWADERDDPELGRVELPDALEDDLVDWKVRRDTWAEKTRADFQSLRLFNWLWDVYTTLERESERFELVIGDGILAWATNGVPAKHPLLIQRLQIEYDPAVPMFSITEADRPPELYSGVLRAVGADSAAIANLLRETDRSRPHPLGQAATDDFLKGAATGLHPGGQFFGFAAPPVAQSYPQIVRAPVVFLRTRALGFEAAIEAIKEDLAAGGDIPESLLALVGFPVDRTHSDETDPFELGDEVEDILLTKEANREQLEIARRLGHYGAVLVQGPPGTGKTHTIANLVGHLLANGQSVLVTSHTTKALRVLREKVVPELQPLCVSVLEGDAAGNEQLKDSVTEIGRRLSSSSGDQLFQEARNLRERRLGTLAAIAKARTQLLDTVRSEYTPIVLEGSEITPIEAAKLVQAGSEAHDWIPGAITPGAALPLSDSEVRTLYGTNLRLTTEDEIDLDGALPDVQHLPAPATIEGSIAARARVQNLATFRPELWTSAQRQPDDLRQFAERAKHTYTGIREKPDWFRHALDYASRGEEEARPWKLLAEAVGEWAEALRGKRLAEQTWAALLDPGTAALAAAPVLEQVLARLKDGKPLSRLGLFTPRDAKRLVEQSSVLGQRPSTVDHFEALRLVALPAMKLAALEPRWRMLMAPFGEQIPGDSGDVEASATLLHERLRDALGRPGQVDYIASQAREIGFKLDMLVPTRGGAGSEWWAAAQAAVESQIASIVESEVARLELAKIDGQQRDVEAWLSTFPGSGDANRPVGQLLNAINASDSKAYVLAHERLVSLLTRRAIVAQREELLARLSGEALGWAEALRTREAPHGAGYPPGDPELAWRWKQLLQALDARSGKEVSAIIAEIRELRRHLQQETTDLIDRQAWGSQTRNIDSRARLALNGYVEMMKKIGKGTGRRAPRLRQAAREQMKVARTAVPVWIAPLARAAESFDPRSRRFDVVIIDEASQSDPLGLIAWYLGKTVIVVGDDQQVTPDSVGDKVDDMTAMIDTYLDGIPNRELYDGQASIYQLASTAFHGVVRLREHFRCVPEIISFSNALSYGGAIVPLRDPWSAKVGPPVIDYHVDGAEKTDANVNDAEARHIAALLAACVEQPEYKGSSFGVISLLGAEQAARIEQLVRTMVLPVEYQNRRILCGTPPNFQGDERDVVFLSMVDTPASDEPLRLRGDPGDRFRKRYNVAVSRAKDQLWVVHSLDRQIHLKTDDLRFRLLDWASNPNSASQKKAAALVKADSQFEVDVFGRLVDLGYRVIPQYPVGAYRIDMVVEGTLGRLAVECDGAAYHSSDDQIRSDLDRQALLERMGWKFHRIRGAHFYRSPDDAMSALLRRLSEEGILPGGYQGSPAEQEGVWSDLLERVKARAREFMDTWSDSDPLGPAAPGQQRSSRRNYRRGGSTAGPTSETPSSMSADEPAAGAPEDTEKPSHVTVPEEAAVATVPEPEAITVRAMDEYAKAAFAPTDDVEMRSRTASGELRRAAATHPGRMSTPAWSNGESRIADGDGPGAGTPVPDFTAPTPSKAPTEPSTANEVWSDSESRVARDASAAQIPLGINLTDADVALTQVTSPDLAASYFERKGLKVEDLRSKGGAFWVYASQAALTQEMAALRRQGIRFTFNAKRNGWWLTNSR